MPRRNRPRENAPEPLTRGVLRGIAPTWAQVDGHSVRQVSADKEYRCPGCQQLVRSGVPHLVVVPEDELDLRRHWHTECWRRELRRRS